MEARRQENICECLSYLEQVSPANRNSPVTRLPHSYLIFVQGFHSWIKVAKFVIRRVTHTDTPSPVNKLRTDSWLVLDFHRHAVHIMNIIRAVSARYPTCSKNLLLSSCAGQSASRNTSNTRDSVSSGYPNTEEKVENTTRSGVFLMKFEVFG